MSKALVGDEENVGAVENATGYETRDGDDKARRH